MTSFLTAGWLCEKAQTVKSAISAAILIAARHHFNGVLAATVSGTANLEVANLWIRSGAWHSQFWLDNQPVDAISSYLSAVAASTIGSPKTLSANKNLAFNGSKIYGMGFTLAEEECKQLISADSQYNQILFPCINAEDITTQPDQSASRWVINFHDWPLRRSADVSKEWGVVQSNHQGPVAADFPLCLGRVERLVKPERDKLAQGNASAKDYARRWWQFGRPSITLYDALLTHERVLTIPMHSKYLVVSWQSARQVFSHAVALILNESDTTFTVLQSTIHEIWARHCGSTLETRMRYTPSDCFETYPFPKSLQSLNELGAEYNRVRSDACKKFNEGLTKIYNRVHSEAERDSIIQTLRDLRVEMDEAVLAAYGWSDIPADHAFRDTNQGRRFAISEDSKQTILLRLLELNKERCDDEGVAGLSNNHAKGQSKKLRKKSNSLQNEEESVSSVSV